MKTLINASSQQVLEAALANHRGSPTRPDRPSVTAISSKAGLSKNTIYNWRNGGNSYYNDLLAVVMTCGGTIKVEFN